MVELPSAHSPLGASGAKRFLACPASVGLSDGVHDEESDHAKLGTAAHALGEMCLDTHSDAWEFIGYELENGKTWYPPEGLERAVEGVPVDTDMANAVQTYLDAIRAAHPDRNQGNFWVERRFHCPSLHSLYYGTSDAASLDAPARHLHVWDYKHGIGVVVEAQWNEQTMYYAGGVLEDLMLWSSVDEVTLHIAQPRGFHSSGPIRDWTVSTADLRKWLDTVLIPGMDRALVSRDTKSGEHCRFCPSRSRACPQLMADIEEFEKIMALINGTADELSNDQLSHFYALQTPVKIALAAANKTIFNRLNAGVPIPGAKLAKAKSNRVFRDKMTVRDDKGAESVLTLEAAAFAKFGADAYTDPELKSPAQIEKLPEGETFAATWAFKPDAGLTVVPGDDSRPEVSRDTKSLFEAATNSRKKGK